MDEQMRIAVVIATIGRPELVAPMQAAMAAQTRPPARLVFSAVAPADIAIDDGGFPADVLYGGKGLTRQRNRAMAAVIGESDIIVFFDDDFVPAHDWLEQCARLFAAHPDIAVATGAVLADGINGAGIAMADAQAIVARAEGPPRSDAIRPYGAPYGCNMAFRATAIGDVRFDERLPLYGWQEDLDFGAQIARRGRMVKAYALVGVHMGTKSGRVSGVRLGASQVINNVYLWRKGTMPRARALKFAARNLAANFAGSFRRDPFVDRRGRLKGNLIGLWHVLTGRADPEYVEGL